MLASFVSARGEEGSRKRCSDWMTPDEGDVSSHGGDEKTPKSRLIGKVISKSAEDVFSRLVFFTVVGSDYRVFGLLAGLGASQRWALHITRCALIQSGITTDRAAVRYIRRRHRVANDFTAGRAAGMGRG